MNRIAARFLTATALSIGAAVLGGLGLAAGAAASGVPPVLTPAGISVQPGTASRPMPAATYATNSKGLTYGSAYGANSVANEPDLIRVLASNGLTGYAYKSQLEADASFTSPAQALAWQEANAGKTETVPVYESDGVTAIGQFVNEPSKGSITTPGEVLQGQSH